MCFKNVKIRGQIMSINHHYFCIPMKLSPCDCTTFCKTTYPIALFIRIVRLNDDFAIHPKQRNFSFCCFVNAMLNLAPFLKKWKNFSRFLVNTQIGFKCKFAKFWEKISDKTSKFVNFLQISKVPSHNFYSFSTVQFL